MTWQKFMTYAHHNIDLLPIPYIDDPLPGAEVANANKPSARSQDAELPTPKPKTLSNEAEETLRQLERKLRNAPPVSSNQVVASRNAAAGSLVSSR